jgi:hypothetical protein
MNSSNRLAVISSPRSGNSWIRSVLAGVLGMQEIAIHNYLDIKSPLPEKCILQLHWYHEPNFRNWLIDNQFKVLCIARHPLDILLSVLHYAPHERGVTRWLEGDALIPESFIEGSTPLSESFLGYALSFGFERLLSVSYQWWQQPDIFKIRYEDCVADPVAVLSSIVNSFDGDINAIPQWLDHISLEKMQSTPNKHGWQGKPGLYKKLITPYMAFKIYRRHKAVFDILKYDFQPYFLTENSAKNNWEKLR